MRLVNLTNHAVVLVDEQTGRTMMIESSGVARVSSGYRDAEKIALDGVTIQIVEVNNREVVGLPAPMEDTIYIVSGLVASVAGRPDVVAPARLMRTGNAVVGARALLRYPPE